MKRVLLSCTLLALLLAPVRFVLAHCEVPCGIYDDQLRFVQMLEDTKTIAKAGNQIGELAGKTDAQSVNQVTRWVATKEQHATNTQHIIAQYFMTQRIKADKEGYDVKLKAAHAVMVSAMKTKQTSDPEAAHDLEHAILDFYRAYEGKDPEFHDHDH